MELQCTRELALLLGVIEPKNIDHHKDLKKARHLLVRDTDTGWPMFWPWVMVADVTAKST